MLDVARSVQAGVWYADTGGGLGLDADASALRAAICALGDRNDALYEVVISPSRGSSKPWLTLLIA
eukprot:scaffold17139_cov123-Isochrysis_galbana.AAC.6